MTRTLVFSVLIAAAVAGCSAEGEPAAAPNAPATTDLYMPIDFPEYPAEPSEQQQRAREACITWGNWVNGGIPVDQQGLAQLDQAAAQSGEPGLVQAARDVVAAEGKASAEVNARMERLCLPVRRYALAGAAATDGPTN